MPNAIGGWRLCAASGTLATAAALACVCAAAVSAATVSAPACVNRDSGIRVAGGGFAPNATIQVDFGTVRATPATTDALGAFAVSVASPVAPGRVPLTVTDGVTSAQSVVRVISPNVAVAPGSGPRRDASGSPAQGSRPAGACGRTSASRDARCGASA
jgi:hypothetical protein